MISGSFTAAGQTSAVGNFVVGFSVSLGGTFSATVLLERSHDSGGTWFNCSLDSAGTTAQWTAPMSVDVAAINWSTQYRLRCTAYTSGTVTYVMVPGSFPGAF